MASRIKAIKAYCPRIVLGKRVGMDHLVKFIARSTAILNMAPWYNRGGRTMG